MISQLFQRHQFCRLEIYAALMRSELKRINGGRLYFTIFLNYIFNDYLLVCFLYFRQRSFIASSNKRPKDLSVSTARCFSSLMRSESSLVENIFFSPISTNYSFFGKITRNNIDIL